MRIVVISDSHGRSDLMKELFEKQKDITDMFVHLGDGERDFADIIKKFPQLKYKAVCGNCDLFSSLPAEDVFSEGGFRILITHGHMQRVKYSLDILQSQAIGLGADVVLFGHTHHAYCSYENGLYVFNPGSLGFNGEFGIIEIKNKNILFNNSKLS